jgi:hypothetical protein
MKSTSTKFTLLFLYLILTYQTQVWCTPMYFTNRADFESAAFVAGIVMTFESFEATDIPDHTVTANFTDFSVSKDNPLSGPGVFTSTTYQSDGGQSLGGAVTGVSFTFNTRILAFGVDVIDFGTCCSSNPSLLFDGFGDTDVIVLSGIGFGQNVRFFGVIDPDNLGGETIISLDHSVNSTGGDQIWFDALSYGIDTTFIPNSPPPDSNPPDSDPPNNSVPEPSTIALLSLGLLGLGCKKRRLVRGICCSCLEG